MRTHLSLNVRNVPAAVAFYQKVFGVGPQKQTADYAKFDLDDPALNFAIQSGPDRTVSHVNHLGIEVKTPTELRRWRRYLHEQGITARREDDTSCCYAQQDKVWFTDPDGNEWEVFLVKQQLPVPEEGPWPPFVRLF